MTSEEMKKLIVKCIFSVPDLTLREWQNLFQSHPDGRFVAISTISGWKNGRQEMSFFYRNILIRLLCDTAWMQKYQQEIRNVILRNTGIQPYQKLYGRLKEKDYESFLKYVLNELPVQSVDITGACCTWQNIPESLLLEMCMKSYGELDLAFDMEQRGANLVLTCRCGAIPEMYRIAVGFLQREITEEELEQKCIRLCKENPDCFIGYIFVTVDVSNELYRRFLEEYRILLLKFWEADEECGWSLQDLTGDALKKIEKITLTVTGIYHLSNCGGRPAEILTGNLDKRI